MERKIKKYYHNLNPKKRQTIEKYYYNLNQQKRRTMENITII